MGGQKEKALKKREERKGVHSPADPKKPLLRGLPLFLVMSFVIGAHGYFMYLLYCASSIDSVDNFEVEDYVALWVPLFFIAICVESVYSWFFDLDLVRLNDAVGSLSLGSLMTLCQKLWRTTISFSPYIYIYKNYRLIDYPANGLSFFFMFIFVDFAYYWVHRTGHTFHMFWAMHGVHHSSEEYNLTTALRQSSIHGLASAFYYLPAAFFFHPTHFFLNAQFNLLYQFWIHTCTIPDLGVLEYVFNTPMQHRVHHGRNPYCIDKNYGGTLSIFDLLFGTFQREKADDPVVFGVTHGLESFDPFWGNYDLWQPMLWNKDADSVKNYLLRFYYGPGWIPNTSPPEEYSIPEINRARQQKFHPVLPFGLKAYGLVSFVLINAYIGVLLNAKNINLPVLHDHPFFFIFFGVYQLFSYSLVFNRYRWALYFEWIRHLLFVTLMHFVAVQSDMMNIFYVSAAIGSVMFLWVSFYVGVFKKPLQEFEIGKDLPLEEGKKVK
mmetsp:Transcript_32626/g.44796  ORF Transcript_32626/g.44796 Transcript_32626/m.44796 type:complete len:494 (+) Transcript_32626:149-1630(+)